LIDGITQGAQFAIRSAEIRGDNIQVVDRGGYCAGAREAARLVAPSWRSMAGESCAEIVPSGL
jgi:hypothetical protein